MSMGMPVIPSNHPVWAVALDLLNVERGDSFIDCFREYARIEQITETYLTIDIIHVWGKSKCKVTAIALASLLYLSGSGPFGSDGEFEDWSGYEVTG